MKSTTHEQDSVEKSVEKSVKVAEQSEADTAPAAQDVENGNTVSVSIDPTFPHGTCSGGKNSLQSSIMHPDKSSCQRKGCDNDAGTTVSSCVFVRACVIKVI